MYRERDSFLRGACTVEGGRATTLPVMATFAGVACTSRGEHEKRSAEDAMKAILFASEALLLSSSLLLRLATFISEEPEGRKFTAAVHRGN